MQLAIKLYSYYILYSIASFIHSDAILGHFGSSGLRSLGHLGQWVIRVNKCDPVENAILYAGLL